MRPISLAHLTCLSLPPPDLIHTAAAAGYDHVGLRLVAVTDTTPGYPLMRDTAMLRATRAALADSGLSVLDIEFIRLTPEFDPAGWGGFLDAGAELGARHVIVAPYDPDHERMTANLAAFAERAADGGLSVALEFFPWTDVPDVATAARIAEATGRVDVGVLVDALHFDRSGGQPRDLAGIDASRFPFLHLCDAPCLPSYDTETLLHTARAERLPLGEGQIDLAALLRAMPAGLPVGVEVPMQGLELAEGAARVAEVALAATRALLAD